MNSFVSAAALASATAIPKPSAAAGPIALENVSFPDLVARLIKIRERWSAQRQSDAAHSRKLGQLFFEATSVSKEEYYGLDIESERWRDLNEVYGRISQQNPDENDPVDEQGCSTAWTLIQDELDSVALAMLNRPPQSFVDLAWQSEALLLAEVNLQEGHTADFPMLPKLFENIRTLAGPLAIPSVVPPVKPDPIFAAIEAHRIAEQRSEEARRSLCDAEVETKKRGVPTSPPTAQVQVGEHAEIDSSYVENDDGSRTITTRRTGKMIPTFARSPGDIERAMPAGLEGPERQAWIDEQTKMLAQETERVSAEWKATPLGKLEASADEAADDAGGRLWELIWTKPTTLTGLAAMLTYCAESLSDPLQGHEWRDALDWTIACSASELAGLPHPPMSDLVAELWEGRGADLAAAV